MTTTPTQDAAMPGPAPAALRHIAVGDAQLPQPTAKPTSRTGQHESTLVLWDDGSGSSSGIWECEPGTFTATRDDCTEVCQIVAGRASIVGDDGTSAELAAGSLLILPQGWRGRWTIHETIRKTWAIITAPPENSTP